MSDDDEHAENPPRGYANFVYWLVRHNDEHVEILRHVEHAVVFVQNRIGNYCRSTGLFVVTGSLSFNGQRCTAIKMIFVPEQYADLIVAKLKDKVERLHIGLPWERHGDAAVLSSITPLPYACLLYTSPSPRD